MFHTFRSKTETTIRFISCWKVVRACSPHAPVSSHCPKTCMCGWLVKVNCLLVLMWVYVSVCLSEFVLWRPDDLSGLRDAFVCRSGQRCVENGLSKTETAVYFKVHLTAVGHAAVEWRASFSHCPKTCTLSVCLNWLSVWVCFWSLDPVTDSMCPKCKLISGQCLNVGICSFSLQPEKMVGWMDGCNAINQPAEVAAHRRRLIFPSMTLWWT